MAGNGFLEQFEARWRGRNGEFFYRAIRAGVTEPRAICSHVFREVMALLRDQRLTGESRKNLEHLRDCLRSAPDAAMLFAAVALDQENLSPEERDRQREAAAAAGKQGWMEKQPPTEKQVNLLRERIGYEGPILNRWHASTLIETLKDW